MGKEVSGVDWSYVEARMGLVSDRDLAREVRVSPNTIRRYRDRKGISPFCVGTNTLPACFMQLLGVVADQKIADMSGFPVKRVSEIRREKGIAIAYSSRHDSVHSTPPKGGAFKWTTDTRSLLGKYSDHAIGKLLGLSKTPVKQERERLGIKPYRQGAQVRWTKKRLALLGEFSDPEVARRLKISVSQVRRKRNSLGIAVAKAGGCMQKWAVYLAGSNAMLTVKAQSEAEALIRAEDELELTEEESDELTVVPIEPCTVDSIDQEES